MATSESSRARRFALPNLVDERTDEAIEAFVQGRTKKSRSALVPVADSAIQPRPGAAVALRSMPGRIEWNAAIERVSARAARYERPTAVAIFELRPLRSSVTMDSWIRVHAVPVGQVLLRSSRATDVVARVAATRFQILLPETTAEAANGFVERIVGECQEQLKTIGAPLKLTASVAASSADVPLRDAVSQALRQIEAA
jgi:hypothetical protein